MKATKKKTNRKLSAPGWKIGTEGTENKSITFMEQHKIMLFPIRIYPGVGSVGTSTIVLVHSRTGMENEL